MEESRLERRRFLSENHPRRLKGCDERADTEYLWDNLSALHEFSAHAHIGIIRANMSNGSADGSKYGQNRVDNFVLVLEDTRTTKICDTKPRIFIYSHI
jgi:hypothetical protein